MRHFLTIRDFTKEELLEIVELAKRIKKETKKKRICPIFKQTNFRNDI
jgi:ornithine carbamoyltransferase